ncbi:MAG TPA: DmsC/YnfH family molybdoenzyme membrane anchor subunit [Symbiobacteriaceae bacterium]
METKEWALILFTVISQAAVGAFLLITWFRTVNKDAAMDAAYKKANLVLLPLAAIALITTLFHLGHPERALNALRNLSTSWLSREIFFAGGFFVMLLVSVLTEKTVAVRKIVDWLTVLAGICAVVSMAAVYDLSMKPAWQGFHTYVAFVVTALFLGAALAAGLVVLFGKDHAQVAPNLQVLIWVAAAAVVAELIAFPFYLASLQMGGKAAQATLAMLAGQYGTALIARWALALVGGLVPLMFVRRQLSAGKTATGLVYTALLFVLAGELVGRYLFYMTGVKIMIG